MEAHGNLVFQAVLDPVTVPVRARAQNGAPIRTPAIVIVDVGFHLSRHWPFGIDIWTVLDFLHGQSNGEFACLCIERPQFDRQETFATGEPITGTDDQSTDQPARVVK